MATIRAEFDGRVFVPSEPLRLPAGTRVEVIVPVPASELTAAELSEWQAILHEIQTSEPAFESVDEALRYSRKRPRSVVGFSASER
jgi:hypothetical protein